LTDTAVQTGGASISQDIFCQDCGYNLRGLTGDRCPECGRSLEGLRSEVSKIPWVHRKEIGRFRAYWKTVWFVMFRQRQFCEEMARPVSYSDSQRFRWLTVAIAYIPLLIAVLIAVYLDTPSPTDNDLFNLIWIGRLGFWVHIGSILFLAAATGIPSYFLESKSLDVQLRNRSISLSYYTCGPLALFVAPIGAALMWVNIGLDSKIGMFAMLCAAILPLALFAIWWLDLIHLAHRLIPDNPYRQFSVAVALPLLWLLLFVLGVGLIPFIAVYITILVFSLF
jgi:hypothetical protein